MARLLTESVESSARVQMIDVTEQIQRAIDAQQVEDGLACVFVPHTTAAITIQENADPATQHDLLTKLDRLVPQLEDYYEHMEGNSDAHVKAALVGTSVVVPIDAGRLALGRWQAIYFCEFDGPRERRLMLKLMESPA